MTLFDADEDHGSVKSLVKALSILEAVAEMDKPSTAEVGIFLGISRPTVHRIVQTLVTHGYIDQDPHSGRLSIGYAVLPLSASQLDTNRLRLEALPHLTILSSTTGERSNLGVLYRNRLLYLAGIEKPDLPQIYTRFGKTAPAHCCSLGKAILANSPELSVSQLVAKEPLTAQTDNTITDFGALREDLAETRRRGFAIDRAEHMANSYCVAAPIFNSRMQVLGAIGLSGRALEPLLAHTKLLTQTAERISHVL
ncbi:MAG: IclR family transcriptional regulator [Alphaproteobacteria bacterium]|nr:IclR family transcriptional regulator [Alphaproteobacteria bacterium]